MDEMTIEVEVSREASMENLPIKKSSEQGDKSLRDVLETRTSVHWLEPVPAKFEGAKRVVDRRGDD